MERLLSRGRSDSPFDFSPDGAARRSKRPRRYYVAPWCSPLGFSTVSGSCVRKIGCEFTATLYVLSPSDYFFTSRPLRGCRPPGYFVDSCCPSLALLSPSQLNPMLTRHTNSSVRNQAPRFRKNRIKRLSKCGKAKRRLILTGSILCVLGVSGEAANYTWGPGGAAGGSGVWDTT